MTRLRVVIGLIWLLALVAGRILWLSSPPSSIASTSAEITGIHVEDDAVPSRAPRVDLFGNEVEEALADYRLDFGGGVYERHSPETAVPKLGPPTS